MFQCRLSCFDCSKMKGNKKGDKQWKGTRRGARGQGKMRRKLLAENVSAFFCRVLHTVFILSAVDLIEHFPFN